jgi:hypothetical protein
MSIYLDYHYLDPMKATHNMTPRLYAKLSRLESAGTVLGLNFVLKFSCLTNHALYVFHSVAGVSSSTSKFRRNVGTSL